MLVLVGLGLWDEKDLNFRGVEEAKLCDILYLDSYTSKLFGARKEQLEKIFEKPIQLADRQFIESGEILNYAQSNKVCLLVGGDPLIATTHTDLLLRAKEKNILTKVMHNTSIYSAIADTGLQMYKFGKSATVTFWEENFKPTSFYDAVIENKKRGLHTLLFLDIKADQGRYMTANEAMDLLLEIEKDKPKKVIENSDVVVCCRLGSPNQLIKYGPIAMLRKFDFGLPLHMLIIPGKLHEMEEKFLSQFK
jgi:diphthine synthase